MCKFCKFYAKTPVINNGRDAVGEKKETPELFLSWSKGRLKPKNVFHGVALNFKVRACLNSKYLQIVSSCLGLAWFFFLLVHNRLQFVKIYSCSNYKQVQYKHYDLSYTPTESVLTILGLRSCTVSLTLHLIIKRTNFLNLSSMSVSMSKRVFYIQSFWYPLSSRFDWNVFIVSSNNRLEYFILKSAFPPQLYSPRNDPDPEMIPVFSTLTLKWSPSNFWIGIETKGLWSDQNKRQWKKISRIYSLEIICNLH